ncbi:MAG: hypothetical protein NVSMB6_15670 [Burkholderiaceae bacterium]
MEKFKQLEGGMLIGPQPTEQDLQEAKRQGIKTVIDFRMPSETRVPNAELAANNGLDYANIPVDKASLTKGQINELDRVMREKQGPYLIHCATGARAAMLLALSNAKKHNWDAERTFEEARAMGYDLKTSPEFSAFVAQAAAS